MSTYKTNFWKRFSENINTEKLTSWKKEEDVDQVTICSKELTYKFGTWFEKFLETPEGKTAIKLVGRPLSLDEDFARISDSTVGKIWSGNGRYIYHVQFLTNFHNFTQIFTLI
jgi:hypothetical protein